MEINTEGQLKLAEDQLKLSLEATQEFVDMWSKNYQSTLGKLAQVPAFGPVREKQEKMMKSIPLYANLYTSWVDTNINLQSVLLEATRKTFEKTVEHQTNSVSCTKDGKSYIDPEKYKEFYKIWIDTYSETFKDFMKSDHYSSDMGKFTSVFIDFQKHNREMIEENYLKPNNLPTRTDIDEINRELYDLRKTVKELVRNIKELHSKEEQSKKVELRNREAQVKKEELHNEEEEAKKTEIIDLKKIVKDLTGEIKELREKEEQEQKADLPKKTDLPKKIDLSKKIDLLNKKEVHT
jgi:hypothetical protein